VKELFLAGRIIVGAYYLFSAFNHFTRLDSMAAFAASKHVPMAPAAILFSGLLLAVAGVSLLFGILPKVGVSAVVLFLLPVTFVMHAFWSDADPATRTMDIINFSKNMGLVGSALMFLGVPEPWPYSVRMPAHRTARARLVPR
jgi:putative oxidoreductase